MKRRTSSRWETISLMAISLLDFVQCTASRMVYQSAYALSMAVPGNTRGKNKRAKFFAAKIEANVQRHVPVGIAILLNGVIFLLLGTLNIREERGGDSTFIPLTVGPDGFFTENATAESPGGGGGGAPEALQEIFNEMPSMPAAITTQAISPEILASITTVAPAPISLPQSVTQPRPMKIPALTAMASQAASKIGTGTGQGSGSGSGSGTGTGTGNGAGNSTGLGGGSGDGTGAGTYSVAGLELPKGEKVWLVIDRSSSMQRNGNRTAREIHRYADTEKNDGPDSRVIGNRALIEAGAKKGYRVIVWITDLEDHQGLKEGLVPTEMPPGIEDPTLKLFAEIGTVLKQTGTRLYIVSHGCPVNCLS